MDEAHLTYQDITALNQSVYDSLSVNRLEKTTNDDSSLFVEAAQSTLEDPSVLEDTNINSVDNVEVFDMNPSDDEEDVVDAAVDPRTLTDPAEQVLVASEHNLIDFLRPKLRECPDLIHVRDADGYTPLHRAAYNNCLDCLKELIIAEADVNSRTNDGWTPLHCAARWGKTNAASILLKNGADVNAVSKGLQTALHFASEYARRPRYRKLIILLLNTPDIDIEIRNCVGKTAYELGVSNYANAVFEEMVPLMQAAEKLGMKC